MFPKILAPVSRYFREKRNRPLGERIAKLHEEKGGLVEILDIGGSLTFWLSIREEIRAKTSITLINLPDALQVELTDEEKSLAGAVQRKVGDARDLSAFADGAFDLVVCNSVIEHVGDWSDMKKAAAEARRVGKGGWIQVPAYEFPIDQHFLLPFAHWLSYPAQIALLNVFGSAFFKTLSLDEQYGLLEHMRPLTRAHFRRLFPKEEIATEKLILPKSHIAVW
jgi:ubiquinone/menaquinone biosynthesis C-methylase UbiE